MERRNFLRLSVVGASAAAFTGSLWGQAFAAPAQNGPSPYGALQAADANGIRLPSGFTSRVIARSRQIVSGTSYTWHDAPDGGACFVDGPGWIYVSNSEISGTGGASAVRFNSSGTVTSAYRILSNTNTNRNCAGGAMPWNTWLSCAEVDTGYVWETYPFGGTAVRRDAMGRFNHEAAAADPVRQVIYLTEDKTDGCLYRFRPATWGNLSSGTLEVLVAGTATSGSFTWATVPDPDGSPTATRNQVSGAKRFNGGEGCYYDNNTVPADHRPELLGGHRPGLLPRRHPAVLLLPARHLRLLVRRNHLRGTRPIPNLTRSTRCRPRPGSANRSRIAVHAPRKRQSEPNSGPRPPGKRQSEPNRNSGAV